MSRTFLAFVAATIAAAVGYIAAVGTLMLQTAGAAASLWILAFAGIAWGAAFAATILLPLWLLFRRNIDERWLQFGVSAVALWATISTALFASLGLSPFEAIGNALTVLPAGVAAVAAFIVVIRGKPYA